jgi:hypothetical protein
MSLPQPLCRALRRLVPAVTLSLAACGGTSSGGGIDPDGMYLLGTLTPGYAGSEVLCNVTTPDSAKAGFPDLMLEGTYALRRSDGRFIYISDQLNSRKLKIFVEDKFSKNTKTGKWNYPSTPEANDTDLACACDTRGGVKSFLVHPTTGDVWPVCKADEYQLYDASGKAQPKCSATQDVPVAIGVGGELLCERSVIDSSGVEHPLSGDLYTFGNARAKPAGGFWVVRAQTNEIFERWTIGVDGAATLDGAYAPIPSTHHTRNSANPNGGALDAKGRYFRFVNPYVNPEGQLLNQIMRFESDFSTASFVYDEASKPICQVGISTMVPPQ